MSVIACFRQLTLASDLLVIREQTVAHGPWGTSSFYCGGVHHLVESAFDVVVQELKNIRFPFGDAEVDQTVPII